MRDPLVVSLLSVLPRRRLARGLGLLARIPLPRFLNRLVIRAYIRHYRVDMTDFPAETEYRSLAEFFARPLRDGARPQPRDPGVVTVPADGVIQSVGPVRGDLIPQAGRRLVDVPRLLGGGPHPFEGGTYAVVYLSPPDYHRVHAPCSGRITAWHYLPGRLFPVFPACAERVEDLFARNERLVLWLDTGSQEGAHAAGLGRVAVVLVGAFGVGRIESPFVPLVSNAGQSEARKQLDEPVPVRRGDELGRFHLGSTVICFFEPGEVELEVEPGERVQVNRPLGRAPSGRDE